ncbi:MAG TPA: hypothetical protein VGM19_06040 [Armatimonadota bacterium]|jgi:hypothetical protein
MRLSVQALLVCVLLTGLLAAAGWSQTNEGNLLKNPGFEDPIPGKMDNPFVNWAFADNGQTEYRGEITAQEFHSGLKAASVTAAAGCKVYSAWAQHVPVKTDAELPDQVSVWYRAPQNGAMIVLSFIGFDGDKSVPKGGDSIALPQSADWTQIKATIQVPAGTRDIQFELRVDKPGSYLFDDAALVRTPAAAAGGKPDRILFVVPAATKVTYLWEAALKNAGWQRVSYETWDNLTPELLKQCRVVVIVYLPLRPEVSDADQATIKLLDDYAKAGGGLMLNQQSGQMLTAMTLCWALARNFGTDILWEYTTSDPARTRKVGAWDGDTFTYTEQVSGPVAQGVKGVLYQSVMQIGAYAGIMPLMPNDPWQVVLTTGANSKTTPVLVGLEEIDKRSRPAGYTSDVPFAGIRPYGQGRVAYFGMYPDVIFTRLINTDDDRKVHESHLVKGTDGFGSDLQKLYLNTFQWLGAGGDQLMTANLQRPAMKPVQYVTAFKSFKGLIGPRTKYSSGQSTAEEYVTRARAAGYDFVIFLEDFAALQPGGFEALKADCKRLSDGSFLALPGVTYQNTDGNHEFAWGKHLQLPSALLLGPDGKRFLAVGGAEKPGTDLTWLYTLLGFENQSGWYLFGQNPYPHFDARAVNAMGVITQEGGKTLESVVDSYAAEARNGQFMWPIALTLMKNASEIALAQSGVYYHNEIGIEGVEKLDTWLNTLGGRSAKQLYPGAPDFGEVFLTNGPRIDLKMPRGDTDPEGNLWSPRLQEWAFDLKVSSPVGLREVRVMDGTTMIRRLLPGGAKEFDHVTSLPRERQKGIWVRAIDTQGREAISRDITSDSWLLRESQCADRENQLLDSRQVRADGTPFFVGYGGDTAIPDKGSWNGRTRPVGCFVFDQKLGAGSMAYDGSPENHPAVCFSPSLWYGDSQPQGLGIVNQLIGGREGGAHVQPSRVSASSDVLIGDRILDGVFPVNAKPVYQVWGTLYPVTPSQYLKTTAREYLYLIKPDGASVYLWDQSFEFLQDVPVTTKTAFALGMGYIGASSATERVIVSGGKIVDTGKIAGKPLESWDFNKGDYVGLIKSPFGSLAVYSLTDGLVIAGDGVNYSVGFKPTGAVYAQGAKLRARMMMVGMHRLVTDPAALAAQFAVDYGLTGTPTWKFEPFQGTVLPADYPAALQAGPGQCFVGRVSGVDKLAANLGVAVSGLRDNWTAFCQTQGAGGQTRIISVERGTGYAVVTAAEEGKTLFFGHPLIADNAEVGITVARSGDWKFWVAEIHNPTDKPIMATVRSNPACQGPNFKETLTLAPGSSVIRILGPAG